jgi:hypothetical protein
MTDGVVSSSLAPTSGEGLQGVELVPLLVLDDAFEMWFMSRLGSEHDLSFPGFRLNGIFLLQPKSQSD